MRLEAVAGLHKTEIFPGLSLGESPQVLSISWQTTKGGSMLESGFAVRTACVSAAVHALSPTVVTC